MRAISGVKKKIIYLDQCLLSRIVKMLDPKVSEERKLRPQFDLSFVEAVFKKLHRLVKLQLVVCPESSFHRKESSVLDPDKPAAFVEHKRVWELLSGKTSFNQSDEIRNSQLLMCGNALLNESSIILDVKQAVRGEIHSWPNDKFRITLNWSPTEEEAKSNKSQTRHYREQIQKLYDTWSETKPSFDQMYQSELRALGQCVKHFLTKRAVLKLKAQKGDSEAAIEFCEVGMYPELKLLRDLAHIFTLDESAEYDSIDRALAFLLSNEVEKSPYVRLSSLLYAEISQRVISNSWKRKNDMPLNDVSFIAAYLPYSDAMFIDGPMHELLKTTRLKDACAGFGQVFSTSNKQAFLDYLDSILEEASEQHLQIVRLLYGKEWELPYFNVLKDDSARRADADDEEDN